MLVKPSWFECGCLILISISEVIYWQLHTPFLYQWLEKKFQGIQWPQLENEAELIRTEMILSKMKLQSLPRWDTAVLSLCLEQARTSSVFCLFVCLFYFTSKHFCSPKVKTKGFHRQNFFFLNLESKFYRDGNSSLFSLLLSFFSISFYPLQN